VHYDATGSTDPDGGTLTFFSECEAWTHFVISAGPPTGTCTFDTPGIHTIDVRVYDSSGYADERIVYVMVTPVVPADTTPPSVTITAPTSGAALSGTVNINVTAYDDLTDLAKVEVYSDSGALLGTANVPPYSVAWNTAGATYGPHTLYAKAYDQAGNVATSGAVPVTIPDLTPPSISITAPYYNQSVTGSAVAITATATDAGGIARVDFFVDGTLLGTATTAPYGITWDTTAVTPGAHTLLAKAFDQAGNAATSFTVQVYVYDSTPPVVTLTAPAAGASLSGSVTLSATASDFVGVSFIYFYSDAGYIGTANTPPYSVVWNTGTVPYGPHTLYAKAYDAALNAGTSQIIAVTVVDIVPPTVSLTAPTGGSSVSGTVAVNASASDNVGVARVEFFTDGNLIASDTTAPYGITWNSTTVAPGAHSLTAKAYDAAGNVTTSAAVSVTVLDAAPPTVAITSPANGGLVTRNATTTITASASDNVGVTKVEFYVGSTLKCTDTTSPYTCAWNVPKTAGVQYSLQAKAYDARGNVGTSTTVTVTSH